MALEIEIPDELAAVYAAEPGRLRRAAIEALVLEGVRSGLLSEFEAGKMLFLSQYEMDGFLKAHDVYLPITFEDVVEDTETALKYSRK